jgi:translocator protein
VLIAPAGYAFAIWGLIYSLIFGFVIYQALPGPASKNKGLLYGSSGFNYLFAINMLFNSFWLIIFIQNNATAFGIDILVILVMLLTAVRIVKLSSSVKLNWIETITIRGGFTIYAGWVLVATILNITFWLKSVGMANDPERSIATLFAACVTYFVQAMRLRNPLFSAVYFWVLQGIASNVKARNLPAAYEEKFMIYIHYCMCL